MIDLETLERLRAEDSAASLRESFGWMDAWPFEGGAPLVWAGLGALPSGDRFHGADAAGFRSEHDLQLIRGQARLLTATNSYAAGVLTNLTNYVIGTGFTYRAVPRSGGPEPPPGLLPAVQQILDEFHDHVGWDEWERELFRRSRRDGEYFLEFFHVGGGRVQVRAVEPEHVVEPTDAAALQTGRTGGTPHDRHSHAASSWSFGIQTPAEDVQTVLGYSIVRSPGTRPEFVQPQRIQHCKVNVDRNVKRGLSDFYPVLADLEGARKLLRNTREGAAIQAAIAFIRQFPAGTRQDSIRAVTSGQADYERPRFFGSGPRSTPVHRFDAGTILNIPAGQEYLAGPLGRQNADNFMLVLQGALRAVAVRWSMPEAMISGDASNANYASSLVAEGPFVKNVEAAQRFYGRRFRQSHRQALEVAAQAGRFRRFGIEPADLLRLLDVHVEPPRVAVRDRGEETEIRRKLHQHGLLSRRTWAALEELDYDTEQQNRHEESE